MSSDRIIDLQFWQPDALAAGRATGAQNDKPEFRNACSPERVRGRHGLQDLHIETAQGRRWFSRIDIPVRDTATDRQLVQTVLRDVTERRLIEEELLAARHSAESSNEAKSRFLATVSHEIRTPLNGVLGMAALLRDTRLTKEQGAYIEALETSGETLLLLIDEVLDFSKVEAGKLDIQAAPVRVGALAESVVELLAPKAHAKKLEIGAMLSIGACPTRSRLMPPACARSCSI